mgnify:CR=1 FL=1
MVIVMKDYEVVKDVYVVTLDNGKVVRIMKKFLEENYINGLGLDEEDAVLTWLEDEEYLINEEQEELDAEAKKYKVGAKATDNAKPRAKREVVRKENPEKEMIIREIAKILPNFAEDVNVENVGKLITFRIGEQEYKIDLVAKRKPKGDK